MRPPVGFYRALNSRSTADYYSEPTLQRLPLAVEHEGEDLHEGVYKVNRIVTRRRAGKIKVCAIGAV